MSLNIKNEETVRLVRELAAELDVSLTAAITDAVRVRLEQARAERVGTSVRRGGGARDVGRDSEIAWATTT